MTASSMGHAGADAVHPSRGFFHDTWMIAQRGLLHGTAL